MTFIAPLLLAAAVSAQSTKQAEYLALARATLENPVTPRELETAVLSPAGVAAIRAVFDRSLDESFVFAGTVVTPELGGESMMTRDGRLELVVYPDPIHPVVRELASGRDQPQKLLAFLQSSREGRFVLEKTGGLHALLYQMQDAPTEAQRTLLDDVIGHTVAQHFKTWTTDATIQAEMIEQTAWNGRYLGFWHIHPPRFSRAVAREGIEPSMGDMGNAIELGQFLTIVYQPDGFDVYDLSPLALIRAENLSRARVFRYRSPEWQRYFEAKLLALTRN